MTQKYENTVIILRPSNCPTADSYEKTSARDDVSRLCDITYRDHWAFSFEDRFGTTCALLGWSASEVDQIECTQLDVGSVRPPKCWDSVHSSVVGVGSRISVFGGRLSSWNSGHPPKVLAV